MAKGRDATRFEGHEMGGGSQFSSGSSCSGGPGRRRVMLCDCGFEAPLVTVRTNVNGNIGRHFYGCGRFKELGRRVCKFYVWHDEEEGSPRDKKLIAGLLRTIEGMKKKLNALTTCCVVGWCLFAFFLVLSVTLMFK